MLRDDLLIVLPADVAVAFRASRASAWVVVGTLRAAKAWHDLPQVGREFIDNFEDDPETVILIPKSVNVRINRATLGELRSWRHSMRNTTIPAWKRFLDTFEVSVYECEACSSKPGSPTLCPTCLQNRAAAGPKWKGPRIRTPDSYERPEPSPKTRLERVAAGLEKDPYLRDLKLYLHKKDMDAQDTPTKYAHNTSNMPWINGVAKYRDELRTAMTDDPTGDDIAADAVRGK